MAVIPDLRECVCDAWRTNNRVTVYLVEHLSPRRTIRMVAAHVHKARCRWIRTLGAELGIAEPARMDRLRARAGAGRNTGR